MATLEPSCLRIRRALLAALDGETATVHLSDISDTLSMSVIADTSSPVQLGEFQRDHSKCPLTRRGVDAGNPAGIALWP